MTDIGSGKRECNRMNCNILNDLFNFDFDE